MTNKEIAYNLVKGVYDNVKFITKWQGYDVFMPGFNKDRRPVPAIGMLPYILVKNGEARDATNEEILYISEAKESQS